MGPASVKLSVKPGGTGNAGVSARSARMKWRKSLSCQCGCSNGETVSGAAQTLSQVVGAWSSRASFVTSSGLPSGMT